MAFTGPTEEEKRLQKEKRDQERAWWEKVNSVATMKWAEHTGGLGYYRSDKPPEDIDLNERPRIVAESIGRKRLENGYYNNGQKDYYKEVIVKVEDDGKTIIPIRPPHERKRGMFGEDHRAPVMDFYKSSKMAAQMLEDQGSDYISLKYKNPINPKDHPHIIGNIEQMLKAAKEHKLAMDIDDPQLKEYLALSGGRTKNPAKSIYEKIDKHNAEMAVLRQERRMNNSGEFLGYRNALDAQDRPCQDPNNVDTNLGSLKQALYKNDDATPFANANNADVGKKLKVIEKDLSSIEDRISHLQEAKDKLDFHLKECEELLTNPNLEPDRLRDLVQIRDNFERNRSSLIAKIEQEQTELSRRTAAWEKELSTNLDTTADPQLQAKKTQLLSKVQEQKPKISSFTDPASPNNIDKTRQNDLGMNTKINNAADVRDRLKTQRNP
ncbi:hypothetical protein [Aquicella lusitana]|uniref:Uncharacterized protein n=1 Tax=Aquicella lusitana TaxID=254246 RepID=A0A370GTA6_9COXI|nr:hypothetical protein [Aquicella lusitana]RDI46932.1 hypothetical protein C8D86_10455 [Aquicella lusitana]VVC73823.1 hypothetical protein AQULUS_15730 [Aquicella lusitana]